MTTLVTGASGFVGHHLVNELLKNDHAVIAIGHHATTGLDNRATYHQVDLLDDDALSKIDLSAVDSVIHLAGLAAVGPSFSQPRHYIDANAGMTINLFEALIAAKRQPRVVVVSSGALYQPGLNLDESSPVLPSSPYAISKLTQEYLGSYYGHRGFKVIIARPFNHIGPGQTPGFIVPDLVAQIQAGGTIKTGNLATKRDYTDVRDIAAAYTLLLSKGRPGETYNICSGASHSGQEILDLLLADIQPKPDVETDQTKLRPTDINDIYGSHAKLTKDTGWNPGISLAQTLKDVLATA